MAMVPTNTVTYLCIIFIIFANVCARPSDNNEVHEDETVDFNTLTKRTLKFKCKPQERAFVAKNFLQEGQLYSNEEIKPNNIILRKCDEQSGCCKMDGFTCGQSKTRQVTFEMQAENKLNRGEKRPINITAFEDIKCECGPKSSPKRNDTIDVSVESLLTSASAGLTINTVERNLLSFMSLLYLIYLLYLFH